METLLANGVAALLTLCILSRAVRDNPAFRAAQYLFVGVSLGYIFVVLYFQVLRPTFINMATNTDRPLLVALLAAPFGLGLLFLPRIVGVFSWLANIPLSLIFGVGAALSLLGVLVGTLIPQILAVVPASGSTPLQIGSTALLALGAVLTLSYFYFTIAPNTPFGRVIAISAQAGRWLLMVAFGFFFAGALVSYLTALSERFEFLMRLVRGG